MRTDPDRLLKRYPQLADYSPEQRKLALEFCRKSASTRHHHFPWKCAVIGLGSLAGFAIGSGVGVAFVGFATAAELPLLARIAGALVLGVPTAVLYARDVIRRDFDKLVCEHLRLMLQSLRCHDCGYALVGLVTQDGRVRCPECGVTSIAPDQLERSSGTAAAAPPAQESESETTTSP